MEARRLPDEAVCGPIQRQAFGSKEARHAQINLTTKPGLNEDLEDATELYAPWNARSHAETLRQRKDAPRKDRSLKTFLKHTFEQLSRIFCLPLQAFLYLYSVFSTANSLSLCCS